VTNLLLQSVIDAGQDFEWYPTTERMIAAVLRCVPKTDRASFMDIGAGDGRVLAAFARACEGATLYAIEKSHVLLQAQPAEVVPVGVDFHEQNLSALPVDYIFCNPPYAEFAVWASRIIETAYAQRAFLVLPRRWSTEAAIVAALAARRARTRVIHQDDFTHADRQARAVIDIVEVTFPTKDDRWGRGVDGVVDPFDQWFDRHISTFDEAAPLADDHAGVDLARVRGLKTIGELVESYDEDYARMEDNYRKIFTLDTAILRELGVSKTNVRDGLKKRMAGLKTQYWQLLFEKLDTITARLSTATKKHFLDRLTGQQSVAFTYDNAFAVVMWAIKHANRYYDRQLVDLFRALATHEGAQNYASNQRTWQKSGWRYNSEDFSHFALDYRIVIDGHAAIVDTDSWQKWDYPGGLHKSKHELIDDMIAVFGNLGFPVGLTTASRSRRWTSGGWQDFHNADGDIVFQVKGYKNGNVHLRVLPAAMMALNIEAARLLGWINTPDDVEREMGYSAADAWALFGCNRQLSVASVRLLTGAADPVS